MFYFGGNPFLCDCNLEWLQTINNEENFSLYPIVNDLESIYCRLMFSKENAVVPLVEVSPINSLKPGFKYFKAQFSDLKCKIISYSALSWLYPSLPFSTIRKYLEVIIFCKMCPGMDLDHTKPQ